MAQEITYFATCTTERYHHFEKYLLFLVLVKYHLHGYSPQNLEFLLNGDTLQDENTDRQRFDAWKVSFPFCFVRSHSGEQSP